MRRTCLCDSSRYCDVWTDYQVSLYSLKEAEILSRQNWREIQHLHDRVCQLEAFIRSAGLPLPDEPL